MTLKGLTLHQPWASLVAIGAKTIETRSWPTRYVGPVAIHAGKDLRPWRDIEDPIPAWDTAPLEAVLKAFDVISVDQEGRKSWPTPWTWDGVVHIGDHTMPTGAIVAVAELVDCVPIACGKDHGDIERPMVTVMGSLLTYFDADVGSDTDCVTLDDQGPYGDFTPGRWAWLLVGVRKLPEPVPCRGAQGLWTVPADVEAAVRETVGT